MTPEQLKASILQYAIQGKLVEQRPEEGTGEELYQQIQAEKRRLIQEKKIKKEKAHPEYQGKDIPFITPGDILDGDICYENQALSIAGMKVARICEAGSILQVCIGGSIIFCEIKKIINMLSRSKRFGLEFLQQ